MFCSLPGWNLSIASSDLIWPWSNYFLLCAVFIGSFWWLNALIIKQHVAQCQAHPKFSINGRYSYYWLFSSTSFLPVGQPSGEDCCGHSRNSSRVEPEIEACTNCGTVKILLTFPKPMSQGSLGYWFSNMAAHWGHLEKWLMPGCSTRDSDVISMVGGLSIGICLKLPKCF